jgi:ABC-type Mn2+/Zn2+ transport system permease subunit
MKTCWSNAEMIILKLCIASAYVLVGAYFHRFFHQFYIPVIVLFAITVVWAVYLWIKKMKRDN